jgi:hypothetical protein
VGRTLLSAAVVVALVGGIYGLSETFRFIQLDRTSSSRSSLSATKMEKPIFQPTIAPGFISTYPIPAPTRKDSVLSCATVRLRVSPVPQVRARPLGANLGSACTYRGAAFTERVPYSSRTLR